MSDKPDFTMSKYAKHLDLLVAKVNYYQERCEELENRPHDEVLLHDMELMQKKIEELEVENTSLKEKIISLKEDHENEWRKR